MSKELFENLRILARDGRSVLIVFDDGSGEVRCDGAYLFSFTDLEDLVAKLAMETV